MADPQTPAPPEDAKAAKQRQDDVRPQVAAQQGKSDELAAAQAQPPADDTDESTVPVQKLIDLFKKHAPKIAGSMKSVHEIEDRDVQLPSAEHKNANKSLHDALGAMQSDVLALIPDNNPDKPQPEDGGGKSGNPPPA